MKGLIIGLIVAALIGGGVWLVATQGVNETEQEATTQQEQREEPEQGAAETTEVSYGDDGFAPKTITVESGTTVTWTNESNRPMWVASDVHPAHNIFPDFDQLGSGDSYSFTFGQTGEWEYHNHLFPSHTGTVIVE